LKWQVRQEPVRIVGQFAPSDRDLATGRAVSPVGRIARRLVPQVRTNAQTLPGVLAIEKFPVAIRTAVHAAGSCPSSWESPLDLSIRIEGSDQRPRVLRDTERYPSLPVAVI
jgi:hypothetical protein